MPEPAQLTLPITGYYRHMRLRVFPSVEAPGKARRELASLANRIDQRSLSDVRTVIRELIGMSVANGARKPIEVALRLDDSRLEGALCDDGTGVRVISRRDTTSLVVRIIDGLVDEWGANGEGKRIWFRMSVQLIAAD
jgi:anti-sigma regulatory factor (Ser/Thr protein kinase)